jgi:Tfp pilus assembly protein PilF
LSEKHFHVAEKHFTRALLEEPDNKIATFNLASVSVRLKKWDQAETFLTRTLELDPAFEPARKLRLELDRALDQ